jgi:hypothetical protein
MFPSFPYLAETIAAERAADYQREAAAYRRARSRARSATLTSRLRTRTRRGHLEVVSSMARHETCAASRAM